MWTHIVRTLILCLSLAASLPAQPRPIPVENEWVRVVVANSPPGQKSRLHKHDQNRVMIHLDPGIMRLAYEGKPVNDVRFESGTVRWDPAGGMHTSENTGGTTYRIVEIELRKPGAETKWPPLDPVRVAPAVYRVEFENPQVRVVRVRVRPGEALPRHTHSVHRVTVALTAARIHLTNADGSTADATYAPGDVRWGGPATHSEKNDMSEPFELILVDIKGSAPPKI